jgi:asparagine synthase (glutamine-hydrolysing)
MSVYSSDMCGIAGEIRFDKGSVEAEKLKKACEILRPRGPDSHGIHAQETWGFAHSRLSIIDLSPTGHQPMVLPDIGITITYNGEIYNYRQLKDELHKKGYNFTTSSDTEVLATAYREWGLDFIKRLYGMFAFVFYDHQKQIFIAARDRLGIKPLYISYNEKKFCFASNIRALLSFDKIDTEIDPVALHNYMSLHAIVPAPRTIFRGVKKLPAATIMTVDLDGMVTDTCYWQADYSGNKESYTEPEWLEKTEQALRTSVQRRLVADVQVGLFLSGGVDSSLIAVSLIKVPEESLSASSR